MGSGLGWLGGEERRRSSATEGAPRWRDPSVWNLSYRFAASEQGRGYATELACEAIVAAERSRPDLPVVASLLEHNLASARVAVKVGMTLDYRGPDLGNPDPEAVRLVYASRSLSPVELAALGIPA